MTGLQRCLHRFVFGECFYDRAELNVQLQIVAQPVPVGDDCRRFGEKRVAVSTQTNPVAGDNAFPPAIDVLPTKRLAGAQRGVEVVILNMEGRLLQVHRMKQKCPRVANQLKNFSKSTFTTGPFRVVVAGYDET